MYSKPLGYYVVTDNTGKKVEKLYRMYAAKEEEPPQDPNTEGFDMMDYYNGDCELDDVTSFN